MTITAPWFALAVDWQDSPMFEPVPEHGVSDPATMGERLAWVLLLGHAKTKGRGGRVSVRKNAFARDYRLSQRAVEGMMSRAQKCGAIEVDGDFVTIVNWRVYQDKAFKANVLKNSTSPKSGKKVVSSTTHVMCDGSALGSNALGMGSQGEREKPPPAVLYAVDPVEVETVIAAIPARRRRKPAVLRSSVQWALLRLGERNPQPDAAWLAAQAAAYYASPEGSGPYFAEPSKWLDDDRFDEDESAWQGRDETKPTGASAIERAIARENQRETG